MIKEKLKKYKIIYYPYKEMKKIYNEWKYSISLKYISTNKRRVKKKIANGEVINVVFVVQYIPGWNKLEPIYAKLLKDSRFNPVLVCVPLNRPNIRLEEMKKNDIYEYFIDHGYHAINAVTNEGWYDLRKLNPDYLFHSRPYNSYMPKVYSSDKLVKYCLICNVMYGANLSHNEQDITLNKDYYKNVYLYFSFDKSEMEFYSKRFEKGIRQNIQKVLPYGAVGLEQILRCKQNAKNTGFKKNILWTPRWSTDNYIGGSNFFNYKDTIFKLAKENPNVKFVIRPHPLMFGNYIKTGQMTIVEVEQFKKYIKEEHNLELDESNEYFQIFWNSDFIITDLSGIVPEYFVTLKPIIYCHSSAKFDYVEYSQKIINCSYSIYNANDLIRTVKKMIADQDDKKDIRKKCFEQYFSNVKNNSSFIMESLLEI